MHPYVHGAHSGSSVNEALNICPYGLLKNRRNKKKNRRKAKKTQKKSE